MAIGTPIFLGAAHQDSAATVVLTTGAASAAGNSIIVLASGSGTISTGQVSSITDTAGNSYTLGTSDSGGPATHSFRQALKSGAAALSAGDTITVNFDNAINNFIMAWSVPNLLAFDAGNNNKFTTNIGSIGWTITSATLAQASEIVFGWGFVDVGQADAFTADASWSGAQVDTSAGGLSPGAARTAYKITSSTSAVTWAPTMGTSRRWGTSITAYKEIIPAAGGGTMSMMGV